MATPKIPTQSKGGFHDTVNMYCAENQREADIFYNRLRSRLEAVNAWETYSDKVKTGFALFQPGTRNTTTALEEGNLIRIDIPGIGNPRGKGYDWTKIVDIQKREDGDYPFFSFTVKPCPFYGGSEEPVAHFYTEDASSTFIVRRFGTCIYAEVHGRNAVENCTDGDLLDNLRNKSVAIGSKLGIGNLNWLAFTESLLRPFLNQKPHH